MKKTVFTISSLSLCLLMTLSATGTAAPSPKGAQPAGSTLVLDEVKPGSLGEWKERFDPKSINPLFGCEEFTSPFDRSTALRTWAKGNTFDTCETKWIRRVYATGPQQTDGAVVEAFLAFTFDGTVYNLPSVKLELLDERGQVVAGQVYFGKGIIGSFNRGQLSNTGHRELPSASGLQRFDLAREFGSGRRFSALAVSLMNYACQGENSVVFDHLVLRPGTSIGSTRPQIPVRTGTMTTGAKTQLASQSIDSTGGVVENSEAGIKITIPPAALKEPVTITIVPQAQHPPLFDEPIPAELAAAIRIGPVVDLGPSGTRFQVPVEVQWRLPDELRTLLRKKGSSVEVGYYNGEIWQPFQNVRTSADGLVSFQTTHFTPVIAIAIGVPIVALSAGAAYLYQTHTHPEKWITADSQAIKDHIKKVTLPDSQALAKGGTVPLGLGRSFTPYISWVFVGNGEKMLTQDTAFCQEATYFTASILRASKDPRFQNFICVRGKETNPKTLVVQHHMWMEIEIDGKIWVVDTAEVGNISLMLKEDAYQLYKLDAQHQFTDVKNSLTKYVGLSKPPPASGGVWQLSDTWAGKWANWDICHIKGASTIAENQATTSDSHSSKGENRNLKYGHTWNSPPREIKVGTAIELALDVADQGCQWGSGSGRGYTALFLGKYGGSKGANGEVRIPGMFDWACSQGDSGPFFEGKPVGFEIQKKEGLIIVEASLKGAAFLCRGGGSRSAKKIKLTLPAGKPGDKILIIVSSGHGTRATDDSSRTTDVDQTIGAHTVRYYEYTRK